MPLAHTRPTRRILGRIFPRLFKVTALVSTVTMVECYYTSSCLGDSLHLQE